MKTEFGSYDEFVFPHNFQQNSIFSAYEAISQKNIHHLRRMASGKLPTSDIIRFAIRIFEEGGLQYEEGRIDNEMGYKVACLFSAAFGQSMHCYRIVLGWHAMNEHIDGIEKELATLFLEHYDLWKDKMCDCPSHDQRACAEPVQRMSDDPKMKE